MIWYDKPVKTLEDVRKFARRIPINEVVIVPIDGEVHMFRMRLNKAMAEIDIKQYVTRALENKEIAVIIIDPNA